MKDNNIGAEGALALAELLPCTNLTYIRFDGNLANGTNLILATQQKALQKVCDDQRCHANLPASQSCGIQSEPDSARVTYSFFSNHSSDHFNFLALLHADSSPISENVSCTPTQIGTAFIGVVGFGLLLYKNVTIVRTVVNAGCRLLQNGFDRTVKTASNFYSFYSLFKTKTGAIPSTGSQPHII